MKTKTILIAVALITSLAPGAMAQWTTSGNDIYNSNPGNVGIGTTTPTKKLEIAGPGSTSSQNVVVRNNSTNSLGMYSFSNIIWDHSVVSLCRARGSYASPTGVQANDRIGSIGGGPYIDNAYRGSVGLDFYVGSSPGVGSYPAYMIFGTTPNSGISRVERMRITESGYVGIGTSSPSYLLDVNGVMEATGYQTASDLRYKQNLQKLTSALQKITKIDAYTYTYNTEKFADKNFPKGEQVGVIAQEVRQVLPNSVTQNQEGYLSVNYSSLIPVLLQAVKELKAELDETRANYVEAELLRTTDDVMKTYPGAFISQNTPNPFNSRTTLEYNIPDNAYSAQISVHDLTGKTVNQIQILQRGSGSIELGSEQLPSGLYLYSLVLDGKPVITKKMIQNKDN